MTPAERTLWQALKGKKLAGLKFRAQHSVGPFILDFYCPARKLVVEVDGDIHATQADYDKAREQQLNEFNYRVIRFQNEEIMKDLSSVLTRILEAANALPILPPDLGGGGAGGREGEEQKLGNSSSPQDWGAGGRKDIGTQ